ncbi:hypothetical protein [Streptomyces sp. NPDC088794]|uniref:hypothetical protein n=1 Tax=Streptomyces sp. NPDC088794 TaxID=3365902 RepID=UPI00382A9522
MTTLAATGALAGPWLGTMYLSGIAAMMLAALIYGVLGSDTIKINTKERITVWGLLTGSMCLAAGGNWVDLITGLSSVPSSVVEQSGLPAFGPGAIGGLLVIISIAKSYKRKWLHAVFALMAAKFLIEAGGIGAVVLNAARMTIGQMGAH